MSRYRSCFSGEIPIDEPELVGESVAIKVPRNTLRAVSNNGLKKTRAAERVVPIKTTRWVQVEAAEQGTSDSVFFAPEASYANNRQRSAEPVQSVNVMPSDHDDIVHVGDDFQVSFVGMSVAPMDVVGGNELLLCSLTRNDGILETGWKKTEDGEDEMDDLSELPTALTVQPGDTMFLHYDPFVDGHDVGTSPDSFVPIPGSKRVYLQRKSEDDKEVFFRFTVMEVDKLNEEQVIAIKSLEDIGRSVGKAANTVPYLKFISWLLKAANSLGRSALVRVAQPEHVLSKDMAFKLAPRKKESDESRSEPEHYDNYLRYGYYFFLNTTVDVKLYAQTGSSSQNVPLLLRRPGFSAKPSTCNEQEFFPLSGVSYVAVKVSRGCSSIDTQQRADMVTSHRARVIKLLKKYKGSLTDMVDGQKEVEGHHPAPKSSATAASAPTSSQVSR